MWKQKFVSAINRGEKGTISTRCSVTSVTLRYILALSYNALGLWGKVIASKSYRSWHIEAVTTTCSYRSGNILAVNFYCSDSNAKVITCNAATFCSNVAGNGCTVCINVYLWVIC